MTRTFTLGTIEFTKNLESGYCFKVEHDEKTHIDTRTRISKKAFDEAYEEYIIEQRAQEQKQDAEQIAELNAELQKPVEITEHGCVNCQGCKVEHCPHRDCMRRNPIEIGGLALCPRLGANKTEEPKKAKKRTSKKHLITINLEDGSQIGLTEKQILFVERMPESDFYENGLDSTLWVDCYCDTLEGDLNAMQVGAMVSTLREKGLITVGSDRRNKKTVKYFALTGLGQMVAKALGLK